MKSYYTYIMSSYSLTLYVGVTNNLQKRVYEHKQQTRDGFTKKYAVKKLVYFEECHDISRAIEREKQIKRWSRYKKLQLIERVNPFFCDLAELW